MKNNKLLILLIIILSISIILFYILGSKTRIGYLGGLKFDDYHINITLELNNLSHIKEQFINNEGKLDEESIKNYIFTNENITNYSYGFKMQYYDKIFRHSDIYGVYIDTNKLLNDNKFIKEINISEEGSPFGNLISYKKIESDKIDNVNYSLKIKLKLLVIIILIICLLTYILFDNLRKKLISDKLNTISYIKIKIKKNALFILIISILFIIIISFLGKKDRTGYISEFELLSSSVSKSEYTYNCKIKYNSKIFKNNIIYEVYPYISKFPKYIKYSKTNGENINIISTKELKYYDKINIEYYLIIKLDIFYYIAIIFIIFTLYYLINEYWKYKKTLDENDYIFINKIEMITLILIIFKIWLFYPGVYYDWDTVNSILRALFAYSSNNWHPIIMELSIKLMDKFKLTLAIFFIINIFLLHSSIFLIVSSLYLKYKNKFVVLLFFIIFIPQIFFISNEYSKDSNATLYTIFSYSIIFFIIISELKNKNIKNVLKTISLISLIIGMLHRHNFIVTVYPILIYFTYDFLKNKNIKNYLFCFTKIMFINAIILMSIYFIFPRIFLKDVDKNATYHIFYLQIAGCLVPSNDSSLIPQNWWKENKNFNDLINQYNDNPFFGDPMISIFNVSSSSEIKIVWLKSIIKHPKNYIKHMFNYTKTMWTLKYVFPLHLDIDYYNLYEKLIDKYIYSNYPNLIIDQNAKINFYNENNGIKITKLKKYIYYFFYKVLQNINILIFILLSAIIFLISFIFILKKEFRNDILIFTFSVSFSALSTAIIVAAFTPIAAIQQYRYIYPVIPISILSLIGFMTFLYNIGILKKLRVCK